MTRLEFIAAWKEHRERILLERHGDDSPELGAKIKRIPGEAIEFWKKHASYLLKTDCGAFFERVLEANRRGTVTGTGKPVRTGTTS